MPQIPKNKNPAPGAPTPETVHRRSDKYDTPITSGAVLTRGRIRFTRAYGRILKVTFGIRWEF